MKKASSAFNAAKFQWCLQLCDALIETKNLLAEAKVISTYRYSTYLSIGAAVSLVYDLFTFLYQQISETENTMFTKIGRR